MTLQLETAWFGEGLLWKRLIIRPFFGTIQGVLMDSIPAYLGTKEIDLSHHTTLEDAIEEITQMDWQYYTELTAYAEEG